jgi:hypothetical protein
MKRRVARVLTFTIGLVLVTGIAYAAKKKVLVKPSDRTPDPTHEEEALRAELLDAAGDRSDTLPGNREGGARRIVQATGYEKEGDKIRVRQPAKK